MLTTINLNAAKRFIEERYSCTIQLDQASLFPTQFYFTDVSSLGNFLNPTTQFAIGSLYINVFLTNAVNSFNIDIQDIDTEKVYRLRDDNITYTKSVTLEYIYFSTMEEAIKTNVNTSYTFFGWIFTKQ